MVKVSRTYLKFLLAFVLSISFGFACGADSEIYEIGKKSGIWVSDQGDGTFINPVLQGDYSDPDVIRVQNDFYLTASSFTNVPGLPILHSKDLVNWKIVGYALSHLEPFSHYIVPRRGGGVWAPAIRFHKKKFMIYYPDPDFGVFVVTSSSPTGPWSSPILIDNTKGMIDPCPFWDNNGDAYLIYAYAASRAGKNNIIEIKKMTRDGLGVVGPGKVIVDGNQLSKVKTSYGDLPWFTLEGPKIYKRNEYFYIFAPAGSVKGGWQAVFRSKNIYGPYEARSVMDQGETQFNGPHQGAWINTGTGEDWFIHFQDTDTYGRRVLLEPMQWHSNNWPVIGERQQNEEYGQPVLRHKKPNVGSHPVQVPVVNDNFENGIHDGWQWGSNPFPNWIDDKIRGKLRLNAISSSANLWEAGNTLTQKLPGMGFVATTRFTLNPKQVGERAGLLILGTNYGWIGLENTSDGIRLVQVTRENANQNAIETIVKAPHLINGPVTVRMTMSPVIVAQSKPTYPVVYSSLLRAYLAKVAFSYSRNGVDFESLGPEFIAKPGRWVGAQIGLFAQSASGTPSHVATSVGYADFDFFTVSSEDKN